MFRSISQLAIWAAAVSFVLMQFFLQLSSGVVIGAIMRDQHLSALMAGLLGSSLYLLYTSLQIPVGMLFDRKNTRHLMTFNALLCSFGCLVFALSHHLIGLFIGRLLIGWGSAFAFVGLSHILRQHFPPRHFAFMIGFSETFSFLVTVIGMISMGEMLAQWGWRHFYIATSLIGCVIAFFCWRQLPNGTNNSTPALHYGKQLLMIVINKKAWINGGFVGLSFSIVTVFGALWAVPFIQIKLHCALPQATALGALFFLGAGVSCPLFGFLSHHVKKRNPLILSSCLLTMLLLMLVLYVPIEHARTLGFLLFFIGCSCGAYMLAFSIANELAPSYLLSTCTGFTNTLAMITAPLLQVFIGYLLDANRHPRLHYQLIDYQHALSILPIALLVASALVLFLPEKSKNFSQRTVTVSD